MTSAEPEPEEGVNLPELLGGFRPSRGGGATARFGAVQAANIRYLVGQVVELLGGDTLDEEKPDDRAAGPRDRPSEKTPDAPDDGLPSADDLAAMIGLTENHELPSDPALARLLPDAYSDDPEASGEFRRSGGGATARFGAAQAVIIRDLVGQVAELVGGDTLDEEPPGERPRGDRPGGPEDGRDDGLASADDLAAMIGLTENAELPAGPAITPHASSG